MSQITMRRLSWNLFRFDLKYALRYGWSKSGRWYWKMVPQDLLYIWKWRNNKSLVDVADDFLEIDEITH